METLLAYERLLKSILFRQFISQCEPEIGQRKWFIGIITTLIITLNHCLLYKHIKQPPLFVFITKAQHIPKAQQVSVGGWI